MENKIAERKYLTNGTKVIYRSKSGKDYDAVVTSTPINAFHDFSPYPTVSLEFRDIRNKLVRKSRVVPYHEISWKTPPYYKLP